METRSRWNQRERVCSIFVYEGEHVVDIRTPAWLRWTGSGLAIVAGLVVGAISGNAGVGFGVGLTMFGLQRYISNMQRAQRRRVRIDHDRVGLEQLPLLGPKHRLAMPEIVREDDATFLRLRSRFRVVDIGVEDEAQARTLVDAIGLGDPKSTSAFVWSTPLPNFAELAFLLAIPGALVLIASVYFPGATAALIVVSSILALVLATFRLYRSEVELAIGADGIVVRQGLVPPRFIRHSQIASVTQDKADILVELASKERLRFSASIEAEASEADLARARSIALRIERARTASAEKPGAPPETPGLLRGHRSTKEWLDALRKLGEGGDSAFRDSAPPRDQLWQIIESIDAPAIERIAAAIALKASGLSAEEAPRLRVAAEGAVEPKLGERLRIVTEKNEEALAEVLEEAQKEET